MIFQSHYLFCGLDAATKVDTKYNYTPKKGQLSSDRKAMPRHNSKQLL